MEKKKFRIAVREFAPFEKIVDHFWEKFSQIYKIDLEVEIVAMDLKKLYSSTLKEKGLKKGLWDIAHINTDWIADAYEKKDIFNLSPMITDNPPEDFPSGWPISLLRLQAFNDEIFGLPFHNGPECLIYRKDLFESTVEKEKFKKLYGYELKVPENWDEFYTIAKFFTRPQEGLYGTLFAGFPDSHNTVFDFTLQLWSRGGDFFIDNKFNLMSSKAEESLIFYRKIVNDKNAVYPNSREIDSIKSAWIFASGAIAMMVNWFGFAAMCETETESKVKEKISVANIPFSGEASPVSLNVYYNWCIGSGSKFKKLAYDFIKFCVNKENDKFLSLNGAIGCRISTWSDDEVNKKINYYHLLQKLHKNAREFPRITNWHEITLIIDEMVFKSANTKTPIVKILQSAQFKVDRLLKYN